VAGTDAVGAVPGLPETAVPASLLDRLPATSPPPPWRLHTRAVVWLAGGRPEPAPAGAWPVTVGAVVAYLDGPVGPYREVFAGLLLRRLGVPAVHVPFIAVDSLPSLRAGRVHWRLPKALAAFTGPVRIFCLLNRRDLDLDVDEAEQLVVGVAAGSVDVPDLAANLARHPRPGE
jgi:hypothetical protein